MNKNIRKTLKKQHYALYLTMLKYIDYMVSDIFTYFSGQGYNILPFITIYHK